MIEKLQRKFVIIVMSVVTIILLAIFTTLLFASARNTETISASVLSQAITLQSNSEYGDPQGLDGVQVQEKPQKQEDAQKQEGTQREGVPKGQGIISEPAVNEEIQGLSGPQFLGGQMDFDGSDPRRRGTPSLRQPALVINIDNDNEVSVVVNQIHFIGEGDAEGLAEIVQGRSKDSGTLSDYELRYLKKETEDGTRIAFVDISLQQKMLKTQILFSITIVGVALILFFVISIFLSRWAVNPVKTAWNNQKQFVANASHELKTPLTVILSNAEMLRDEDVYEYEKDLTRIDHIHSEAIRMKILVEDLLVLAKHDNSKSIESAENIDFSYIVKSSVLVYEPIIYDEQKTLIYDIEDGLKVHGDESQLKQVINILLDNANKYSEEKGKINLSLIKNDSNTVLLTVSNTGNPIQENELENIFLRFYRLDEARSEHGSFGLGLSIAKSVVVEHKGKIWAESDGVNENTFYVSFPLA